MFRLLEYMIGSMAGKVLEYIGFNKLMMQIASIGLRSNYLIQLGSQSPMKASRSFLQ